VISTLASGRVTGCVLTNPPVAQGEALNLREGAFTHMAEKSTKAQKEKKKPKADPKTKKEKKKKTYD
jgi:hypothetical protein